MHLLKYCLDSTTQKKENQYAVRGIKNIYGIKVLPTIFEIILKLFF